MYGNYKRNTRKGKKKKLTPTQKAFKAGVKAGMARARQGAGRYWGRRGGY